MDAVFAILVLGAVVFFGALISAGNERQRKALEGIREQAAQWAMQDLRLKREKLAREVKVDDPVAWLNQVVEKVYGENMDLTVLEVFNDPQALVCSSDDGRKVVFSPASPTEIHRLKQKRKSKLSYPSNSHPLMNLPKGVQHAEISILNGGFFFDLEFSFVWKGLANTNIEPIRPLSLYYYSV